MNGNEENEKRQTTTDGSTEDSDPKKRDSPDVGTKGHEERHDRKARHEDGNDEDDQKWKHDKWNRQSEDDGCVVRRIDGDHKLRQRRVR